MNDELLTISDEYRRLNVEFHKKEKARGKPWGMSARKYFKQIRGMVQELGARDILDYGCGQCTLTQELRKAGIQTPVYEYDPCIEEKMNNKQKADLVVNTDVMEHIESDLIENVLWDIWNHANKGIFFVIATVGSSEWLTPDINAHQTVESPVWWLNKLEETYGCDIVFGQLQPKRLWVRIYK